MHILPLLSLIGYYLTLRRYTRWSAELIPFFAISALSVLLYLFGLIGFLQDGRFLLLTTGIVLLAFSPWYLERKKRLAGYFTPGLLFLILFGVFFGFFAAHTQFSLWQEFIQWGARAKLIVLQHHLLLFSNGISDPSFPPGAAIFYYWFFAGTSYSENMVHLAQQVLLLLPLGVLVKKYEWPQWQRAFLTFSLGVYILLVLHVPMASDVNLDLSGVNGVYFSMMLMAFYYSKRRWQDLVFLIAPLSFFVLLQSTSLETLVLFVLLLALIQVTGLAEKNRPFFIALSGLFLTSLLTLGSWYWYAGKLGHPFYFHFNLGVLSWSWGTGIYYSSVVLAIALMAVVTVFLANSTTVQRQLVAIHATMFFAVFLLPASYPELTGYFVAWGLMTLGMLLPEWRASFLGEKTKLMGSMVAFALIVFPTYLFANYFYHLKQLHQKNSLSHLRRDLQPLIASAKLVIPAQESVFVIWQNSNGFEHAIIAYELLPRKVNPQPSSFGRPYGAKDHWTQNISRWRLEKLVGQYDVVLFAYTDDQFWQNYGEVFAFPPPRELDQYLICQRDGFNGMDKKGCWVRAVTAYLYTRGVQIR